jgi:hypothetical protein
MLTWERLQSQGHGIDEMLHRAKVPGGWLVRVETNDGDYTRPLSITFLPDPNHAWDGSSLR